MKRFCSYLSLIIFGFVCAGFVSCARAESCYLKTAVEASREFRAEKLNWAEYVGILRKAVQGEMSDREEDGEDVSCYNGILEAFKEAESLKNAWSIVLAIASIENEPCVPSEIKKIFEDIKALGLQAGAEFLNKRINAPIIHNPEKLFGEIMGKSC